MTYFNFKRIIEKYSSEFKLIQLKEGFFDDTGVYVKGDEVETVLKGAIINFKESKLLRSEGTLKANDKHLYMLEPICKGLDISNVIHQNKKYNIEQENENAKFSGVYSYVLRFVSAFDNNDTEIDLEKE